MRVLFTFGGITPYINRLLETLTEKGLEVTAVVASKDSSALGKNVKLGPDSERYNVIRTPEQKSKRSGKPHFSALPDIIKKESPDIVVLGWPYFLDVFFSRHLLKAIRQTGAKLMIREIPYQTPPFRGSTEWFRSHPVYDENMNLLSQGFKFRINSMILRHIRRFIYRRADGALNYHSGGPEIISTYGIPEEKIYVTYNSTDVEALWTQRKAVEQAERLLPENPHRIVHIGRLVKMKRVDLLLQAVRNLSVRYPDAELLVIGDGPELETLREEAAETGIADRVRFTGAIYDSLLLYRYMYESSVYVLAGTGGLSLNDAMACGLPAICSSACDGTQVDLIEDGINGYIFDEGSIESLTGKLDAVLSDTGNRKRMGLKAYETIRDRINLDTVSDRFIEAFKSTLS